MCLGLQKGLQELLGLGLGGKPWAEKPGGRRSHTVRVLGLSTFPGILGEIAIPAGSQLKNETDAYPELLEPTTVGLCPVTFVALNRHSKGSLGSSHKLFNGVEYPTLMG